MKIDTTALHTCVDGWRSLIYRGMRMPEQSVCKEGGERLSRYVGRTFPALGSRSQGYQAAKRGYIHVNGQPGESSRILKAGDVVSYPHNLPSNEDVIPSKEEDSIIRSAQFLIHCGLRLEYEDNDFAVIFKPSGFHSKPYKGAQHVETGLPALLTAPREHPGPIPGPIAVHRLDSSVCGLLVVAKTRKAAVCLSKAFEERRVKKRYRAILLGNLSKAFSQLVPGAPTSIAAGAISDAAPAHLNVTMVSADPISLLIEGPIDGRDALTRLSVVSETPHVQEGALTTVDLEPVSGRRHQLRLHVAALGFPILGDDLYCSTRRVGASRTVLLQCVAIDVPHPTDEDKRVAVNVHEIARFDRARTRAALGYQYMLEHGDQDEVE